jgi:hypothetical protein
MVLILSADLKSGFEALVVMLVAASVAYKHAWVRLVILLIFDGVLLVATTAVPVYAEAVGPMVCLELALGQDIPLVMALQSSEVLAAAGLHCLHCHNLVELTSCVFAAAVDMEKQVVVQLTDKMAS